MHFRHLLLLSIFLGSSLQSENPTVWTKYGKIRGYFRKSYTNRTYEAYEGIPFAMPPTGNRRFEVYQKLIVTTIFIHISSIILNINVECYIDSATRTC